MLHTGTVHVYQDVAAGLAAEQRLVLTPLSRTLLFVVLHPLPADTPALRALHVDVVRPAVAGVVAVPGQRLLYFNHLQINVQ